MNGPREIRPHVVGNLRFFLPSGGPVHVALRTIRLVESFKATVDAERMELLRSITGAQLLERTGLTLVGRDARMFTYAGRSADGVEVRYHHAFLHDDDAVVVVSALGTEAEADEVRAVFERVLTDAEAIPRLR